MSEASLPEASLPEASRIQPEAGLELHLLACALERHPFAVELVRAAWRVAQGGTARFEAELRSRVLALDAGAIAETTPGVSATQRLEQAAERLLTDCAGVLARETIRRSFTREERRELLWGMLLTRATDNRLKSFFTGGEVRWQGGGFQGKGFRSLGQEAIYAATLRLRRGEAWRGQDGSWRGDVVAPMIRDAGLALGMAPTAAMVRRILNAQMGKAGPPMHGRDLHVGDFELGVLPPAAPLSIATLTLTGIAWAMAEEGHGRVALSMIGEGGSSLGEWHEAVNLSAARRLPIVFCVQNNQTALATRVAEQSAVRVFADKAEGYGIPGLTIDGTDPEAIAAAFAWAVERARAGLGPCLIETVAMRMCGHAHHDDMLYLGKDPQPGWQYPELAEGGYVDRELYHFWAARDPIERWAERLTAAGELAEGELEELQQRAEALVEAEARAVIEAPWPDASRVGHDVDGTTPPRRHREPLAERLSPTSFAAHPLPELEPGAAFDPRGRTFLEAIQLAVAEALRADPRVFLYGQDVGPPYGNAFLLLAPLLAEHGRRIHNSTLAEGGILGVATGAALAGSRPIAEIQFNDFVATGFNQLVNNAAKIRYRWGAAVPMVVRMPWGGLRAAGPYHSQNTEAWFYRTPGLKIVAPSTPEDARALFAAALADPDPVLFYEHIALYRDPRIKQALPEVPPAPLPLGRAALRRAGSDLAIISYGAYVHRALAVASRLATDGIEAAVLDLRSLAPLDRPAAIAVARHCGRVLIVHEDSRTGGIGESLAAILQEEVFEFLDAPIRIIGALDTPVPYSPPLEAAFLPSEAAIERAARALIDY